MLDILKRWINHLIARLVVKDRDLHSLLCPCGQS